MRISFQQSVRYDTIKIFSQSRRIFQPTALFLFQKEGEQRSQHSNCRSRQKGPGGVGGKQRREKILGVCHWHIPFSCASPRDCPLRAVRMDVRQCIRPDQSGSAIQSTFPRIHPVDRTVSDGAGSNRNFLYSKRALRIGHFPSPNPLPLLPYRKGIGGQILYQVSGLFSQPIQGKRSADQYLLCIRRGLLRCGQTAIPNSIFTTERMKDIAHK